MIIIENHFLYKTISVRGLHLARLWHLHTSILSVQDKQIGLHLDWTKANTCIYSIIHMFLFSIYNFTEIHVLIGLSNYTRNVWYCHTLFHAFFFYQITLRVIVVLFQELKNKIVTAISQNMIKALNILGSLCLGVGRMAQVHLELDQMDRWRW